MTKFPLHVADVLQTAGDIVSHIGWTQHADAENEYGDIVSATDKNAACFCAMGAIRLARSQAGRKYPESKFFQALEAVIPAFSIPRWNDSEFRSQEDVSSALYAAAENVRAQHA